MAKKFLAILIAVLMVAALVACTPGTPDEETTTDDNRIDVGETTSGTESESEETDETGEQVTNNDEKTPGELDYTESQGKVYILHVNGAVNLRKADGTVFKSFSNGTELQKVAVSTNGEWTKVVYENEPYYIISSGVTVLADLDEGFEDESFTLVLATDSLKIRIAPDYENTHDAIGFYQKDDEVKVVAVNTTNPDEPWYKVEFVNYSGETVFGYVSAAAKHYVQDETDTGTGTEADTTTETEGSTGTETETE
ncbi:MAG: hypothetical protein IJC64_00165 [Clostridia bacterium]|nr:hypothetical protein [Clostridia bacterium]